MGEKPSSASQGEGENVPGRDPPHSAPRTGHRGGSEHPSSPSPPVGVPLRVPTLVPSPCPSRPAPPLLTRRSLSPPLHHPSRHGRRASRLGNTTPRNHCLTLPPAPVTSPRERSPFRSQWRKSSFFPLKEPRSDPLPFPTRGSSAGATTCGTL